MKCIVCNKKVFFTIANKIRNQEKRDVFYCHKCDLGFLDYMSSEQDLKDFYNKDYRKKFKPKLNKRSTPAELFDIYSNFQDGRISLIKKYLTKKLKLLDIGCSSGMFLYRVKKYVKETVGIDYDSRSARFAAKKCSCDVFTEDIEKTGLKQGSLDIICALQVLEHVKDPRAFLENIKKYLKPNGMLYIEVPNLHNALLKAYDLANHHDFYFHAAHLWYFTARSLGKLTRQAGFKGRIFFSQDYNFLNHLHWIDSDSPQLDCIPGLSSPCFPLRKSLQSRHKNKINDFIIKTDNEYKKLLTNLGMTSNISFIGRKR